MAKKLIITEKPTVAREFAAALKENMRKFDGYMESQNYIITWCVGHLVTMCYPEAYDPELKKWDIATIPFIPEKYLYQVMPDKIKQFEIIKSLFNRDDIDTIYNAGDSGREGEYIQRLVLQEAGYNKNVQFKRVWIDSQTEEEILRGIREAKDMSEYDNLSDAAYLRAKEDYLMGINFSRVLTLKYGYPIRTSLGNDRNTVIAVGRVMTCVLGMVVNREREIRSFVKTPFFKINADFSAAGTEGAAATYTGEWKLTDNSKYKGYPNLYKENGFLKKEDAQSFIDELIQNNTATVSSIEKKKNNKAAPLLYNLAELQNECSKLFKISPDDTLKIAQELYEKKMTTYPRTDARVLSTAVAKTILTNISGLKDIQIIKPFAEEIITQGLYKNLEKTKYVNDKQITDHYAIIPTGQGIANLKNLSETSRKVYEIIVRRFLAIFYKPAVYQKLQVITDIGQESFVSNYKTLLDEGYLKVMKYSFTKSKSAEEKKTGSDSDDDSEQSTDENLDKFLNGLKKNTVVSIKELKIKEGETSPPKRYNSGSIILAMENAGELIEDEELRATIKGSGIGTSATRAGIITKLNNNGYLRLNNKTQIITPTMLGEMIYEIVARSIKSLLDPKLTANWEKGLTQVADGTITSEEYLVKLNDFVVKRTNYVKENSINQSQIRAFGEYIKQYY